LDFNISGSLDDLLLVPYTSLAAAYTYYPTYFEVLQQYNNPAVTLPVFMEEGYYEGGTYGNLTPKIATTLALRKVPYWTVLSGGLGGYMYGTQYGDFHAGWQAGIASMAATQVGYFAAFFQSLPWYDVVPDQKHIIVTAGYGTATGNGAGNIQTDDYVTTAYWPNGSGSLSYAPESTTLTVALSQFSSAVSAKCTIRRTTLTRPLAARRSKTPALALLPPLAGIRREIRTGYWCCGRIRTVLNEAI